MRHVSLLHQSVSPNALDHDAHMVLWLALQQARGCVLENDLGPFFGFQHFAGFPVTPVQLGDPIRRLVQPAVMQSSTQDGELHADTLELACG